MKAPDTAVVNGAAELVAWLNGMWTHDCRAERARISVGAGEPCNWCGAIETD